MLLTKEVEVKPRGKNVEHYESKGYVVSKYMDAKHKIRVKMGTTLMVKVEDLPENSSAKVACECDNCGTPRTMPYYKYCEHNHNGKTYCKNCCHKILQSGFNHWNWNNNKTAENREYRRHISGYSDFIKHVLSRDNFTCQCCKQHGGSLEVHHLDGYDWCEEKRTDDTNGITLCENCHSNFHARYGYGGNTKEQFEEWFGKTIELVKHNGEILTSNLIICLETKEIEQVRYFVEKYKTQASKIYRCCNGKGKTTKNKHYLWYDDYTNMSESDITNYLRDTLHNNCKAVICLNTKEIFYRMSDALKKYQIHSPSLLTRCCKGINSYAGFHPLTGEKLKWMYLKDYLNLYNKQVS